MLALSGVAHEHIAAVHALTGPLIASMVADLIESAVKDGFDPTRMQRLVRSDAAPMLVLLDQLADKRGVEAYLLIEWLRARLVA